MDWVLIVIVILKGSLISVTNYQVKDISKKSCENLRKSYFSLQDPTKIVQAWCVEEK